MNSEQKKKTNEKRRKRYAEDQEYRERTLAAKRGRRRRKVKSDPQFRENERSRWRTRNWKKSKIANAATVDYDRMLARQGGVCKICRKPSRTRLCLDHDHANGRARALLCRKCNFGLGLYDDDIGRLLRAAAYLVLCGALPALACALVAAMARFLPAAAAFWRGVAAGIARLAARARLRFARPEVGHSDAIRRGLFPSPLWGGARGGGSSCLTPSAQQLGPPPQPSPTRGEGAHPSCGIVVRQLHRNLL